MGLKTFDKWPDGTTTVDKKHWTSNEPAPEDSDETPSEDFQTPPVVEEGDNLGLKIALRPIKHFTLMRAEFPLEIIDELKANSCWAACGRS